VHPHEKILGTPVSGRKGRKAPRLTLVWGPRMVNPALARDGVMVKVRVRVRGLGG